MSRCALAASCGLLLSLAAGSASAGQLVIEMDYEFSGAAWPNGSGPWARATFTDQGGGVVELVLECLLQDSGEFMAKADGSKGWAFNLDPALDPDDLTFTDVGTGSDVSASAILTGADDFSAGPDKWFDIVFQFGDGMVGGEIARYDITIAGGLSALSFDFVTGNGPPNKTGFHSAAHVQSIASPSAGQGSSGWMGGSGNTSNQVLVPLPTAGVMAMAGMGLVASRRRRAM